MKRSLDSKEKDVPPAKKQRLEPNPKSEMDVDEDYKCSYCNQKFDSEISVKIHEGLKHRGPCCCLTCGKVFDNEHAVKVHVGMKHKDLSTTTRQRQEQLKNAARKYNKSEKGRERSRKYEKTTKAKNRRKKYKNSMKGRLTIGVKKREETERKRQEKQRGKAWNMKDWQKTESAKHGWRYRDRRALMEYGYNYKFLEDRMKEFKEVFGSDDYFGNENEDVQDFKIRQKPKNV